MNGWKPYRKFLRLLPGLFLAAAMHQPGQAVLFNVDDFEKAATPPTLPLVPQIEGGVGWEKWSNMEASNRHTAEATGWAGKITAGQTAVLKSNAKDAGDLGMLDNYYLGLYVWGGGGGNLLQIRLYEEDTDRQKPLKVVIATEVWESVQYVRWRGWKYLKLKLSTNGLDFAVSPKYSNGNTNRKFDPEYEPESGDEFELNWQPEVRGLFKIELVNIQDVTSPSPPTTIYVDEITFSSPAEDVRVEQVFPANDNYDTRPDAVVTSLPPVISARLGAGAIPANSRIVVVEDCPFVDENSGLTWYPDDNLIDPPALIGADDSLLTRGIAVVPNDFAPPNGDGNGEYTKPADGKFRDFVIFVTPKDGEGNRGKSEVVVLEAVSRKLSVSPTVYSRERGE